MSDIDDIIRARSAQNEALVELEARILACKESMKNYECLADTITTLPDKLSHQVMVPFGKLAFMPGRLVHTNELLVHLGDSYFASMSCKQALKTIELRQENLQNSLADLEKVSENIEKKKEFYEEMEDIANSKKEFEIQEECPADYTHPKERHRISMVKENNVESKHKVNHSSNSSLPVDKKKHEEMMRRLEELERLEEEEDELCRFSPNDQSDSSNSSESETHQEKKHVKWKDECGKEPIGEAHTMPKCDEEKTLTIKFKHSEQTSERSRDYMTPGDIYAMQVKNSSTKTTSILKKTPDPNPEVASPKKPEITAVSETVFERNEKMLPIAATNTATNRPVSKFKAGRKKF